MIKMISSLLSILDKVIPFRSEQMSKRILKEDIKLKKAILEGDMQEIEKIRTRKAKYREMMPLILFFCLLAVGCTSNDSIPILGDNVPTELKIGSEYTTVDGSVGTVQSNKNKLVSDAYIFESVSNVNTKKGIE